MNIAYPTQLDKYQAIAAATFPKCFSIYEERRRPLKLNIALGGAIPPAELHNALQFTSAPVDSTSTASPRELLPADEEAYAKATLVRIKAKKAARAAAAKAQTPPVKRLSLADLKTAAMARKTVSQEEITHAQNAATRCGKHRVGAKGQ